MPTWGGGGGGGGWGVLSTLLYMYPHKAPREIKWLSVITRLTAHLMCGLMSDLAIYKHRKKSMVIQYTECPH